LVAEGAVNVLRTDRNPAITLCDRMVPKSCKCYWMNTNFRKDDSEETWSTQAAMMGKLQKFVPRSYDEPGMPVVPGLALLKRTSN